MPQLDEELDHTLDEVTETVRAGVDVHTDLELIVLLIPLLLSYKATLDVGGGLDLRQAWGDLTAWVKERKGDNG